MRPSRRRRLRWWIPSVLLVLLSPVIYSWSRMATEPSSLPLGVRSVEWLRTHHGNWIVDEAEQIYYSWNAPKKGGPQLKALPAVGLALSQRERSDARRAAGRERPAARGRP